jgi:hypothetical protein
MRHLVSAAVIFLITISGSCQHKSFTKPNIFYVAIGSCVYEQPADSPDQKPLFPEKIYLKDLLAGFERDYANYEQAPATIRMKDSLNKVLHTVILSQQERAHDFVEAVRATDTFPGDCYINRCDGGFRGIRLKIRGKDTSKLLDPPIPMDTFTAHTGSFYDISDFKGARKSAVMISTLLDKMGAKGITISSEDQPVSRNMFFSAVDSLWKMIQRAHKPDPMIIFYYCGHGYADGFGRRFLVPGTFTGVLNKMPIDTRRLRSVFVKDLYDYLELAGYPFIIFLDCCSENQGNAPRDDINDYYLQMAVNADGPELDRMVYEHFFQPTGDDMVIYSSILGSNSIPVSDPLRPNSITLIGPLCRRMLIADQRYKDTFLSFDNMRKRIMLKGLDAATTVPGIYSTDSEGPLIPGSP